MDRYYKRFVRDYIHYVDIIFCKSALIIAQLLEEGKGTYSSFHIRRLVGCLVCVFRITCL